MMGNSERLPAYVSTSRGQAATSCHSHHTYMQAKILCVYHDMKAAAGAQAVGKWTASGSNTSSSGVPDYC